MKDGGAIGRPLAPGPPGPEEAGRAAAWCAGVAIPSRHWGLRLAGSPAVAYDGAVPPVGAQEGSMTGPVERVALTHLQIPLKEPLRPGDVEHSLKDAILVTVETGGGVGLGECAPIAPFAGAPGD